MIDQDEISFLSPEADPFSSSITCSIFFAVVGDLLSTQEVQRTLRFTVQSLTGWDKPISAPQSRHHKTM